LEELKKQNPELAKILNATDTATSAWAKYQLALKGVNLDLQNLSATAAESALKLQAVIEIQTLKTLKGNDAVKKQYNEYDKLTKRIKSLRSAAEGQSVKEQIDSRKSIELLNERIKKIKEAADAKIKALRSQAQAENDQLELQKLQLEYQEAIARGDQDAAARAQITLQQFTNQVQTKKAEESIIAKAELEIKPLQDQIDKLNNKNKELADKAALAGESLSKLEGQASTLKDKLSNLEKTLSSATFNKLRMGDDYEGSATEQDDLAATETARRDLGLKKSVVTVTGAAHPRSNVTSRTTVLDIPGGAKDMINKTAVNTMAVSAQVVNLIGDVKSGGGRGAEGYTRSDSKQIPQNASYKTKDKGLLDDNAKRSILLANPDLGNGSFFEYNGRKYKVNSVVRSNYQGIPYIQSMDVVAQKSLGGAIAAGQTYMFNDRIGPLGAQKEGFIPNIAKAAMSGFIYPNINTMPTYNVPTNQKGGVNIQNSPSSNNIYNIDIALNGTNVTVDDVMRKFEEKMASINARQGRAAAVKPVVKSSIGA